MRLRIRFAKVGKIRFIGHRDVARVVERAVRKVGLPVAYSEGFSPRMKLSFGLALPTGYESDAEFLELPLAASCLSDGDSGTDIAGRDRSFAPCSECSSEAEEADLVSYCSVADALSEALPVGMSVSAAVLTDGSGPSLQAAVLTCGWRFEVVGLPARDAAAAVEGLLAADTVVVERLHKGEVRSSDIRSSVVSLGVAGPSGRDATATPVTTPSHTSSTLLCAELSANPRVVRPSELVTALAPTGELGLARRTHQWTCGAAGRAEPAVPSRCAHPTTQNQETLQ